LKTVVETSHQVTARSNIYFAREKPVFIVNKSIHTLFYLLLRRSGLK